MDEIIAKKRTAAAAAAALNEATLEENTTARVLQNNVFTVRGTCFFAIYCLIIVRVSQLPVLGVSVFVGFADPGGNVCLVAPKMRSRVRPVRWLVCGMVHASVLFDSRPDSFHDSSDG